MDKNISIRDLSIYVNKQLTQVFPDGSDYEKTIHNQMNYVMERIDYCFSRINNKYYSKNGITVFDYLNSDHYASFLYLLSNALWYNEQKHIIAKKVYYLNKVMHGIDIFYEVELPRIFQFTHPVGTVLGRAHYSDYLMISHGVTIGGNKDLEYPEIGEGVYFYAGSAAIGRSKIGSNNLISIGTIVRDTDTPNDVLVYNKGTDTKYKDNKLSVKERYFKKRNSVE